AHTEQSNNRNNNGSDEDQGPIEARSAGATVTNTELESGPAPQNHTLTTIASEEETKKQIRKAGIKEVEDYAKQSAKNLEQNGTKMLSDYIKKQTEAKVAAL